MNIRFNKLKYPYLITEISDNTSAYGKAVSFKVNRNYWCYNNSKINISNIFKNFIKKNDKS